MTTLAADCVTTEAGLHDLAPDWRGLWARVPGAGPFQSQPWLSAWWSAFGTGRPIVGVLREPQDGQEGRLLGLLPAYVLEEADGRKLLPIGAGISDHLDALLAPDAPADAADRLLDGVLRTAGVDRCDLIELPPDSPLRRARPQGWQACLHAGSPCPVLLLPPTVEGLRAALPAGTHRKLRMNGHRAARAGGVSVQTADRTTLPALLDALFALHQARWQGRGQPGVLADPRVRAVIAGAAPALLASGTLRLAALRIGGELAAACLAFAAGPDRLLCYMSGFAAEHASCSPGSLLLAELARSAIEEGRRELHFLRGNEAYKYAWGAADQHNAMLQLVRR